MDTRCVSWIKKILPVVNFLIFDFFSSNRSKTGFRAPKNVKIAKKMPKNLKLQYFLESNLLVCVKIWGPYLKNCRRRQSLELQPFKVFKSLAMEILWNMQPKISQAVFFFQFFFCWALFYDPKEVIWAIKKYWFQTPLWP